MSGHDQFAALARVAADQIDFVVGQDRHAGEHDNRELFENWQCGILVENYAPGDVLIDQRFVRAQETLKVVLRFLAREPIARSAAEIEANLGDGFLAEVLPARERVRKRRPDTLVGERIKAAVEGRLVHDSHKRPMRQ